jgi:type VI secretion system secreted protein VgrG
MLGFDANGAGLKGAVVKFYDSGDRTVLGCRQLDATGESPPIVSDSNKHYVALMGYEGWTPHFEEIPPEPENDGDTFDPGELEEDRNSEHL